MAATPAFAQFSSWGHLWQSWQRASAGKRARPATAAFEHGLAEHLLQLQAELRSGTWQPQPYTHFVVHEAKRRRISAAAFRDRVVHHALCGLIEPRFERVFLPMSFANRPGKGTHAAVLACRRLAAAHSHVLRADIRQHFPSVDHQILAAALRVHVPEDDLMAIVGRVLASGDGIDADDAVPWQPFDGDDLLAACRPRGLPIGNLTSQFWSNVVLHALDLFVVRELGCRAYVRYVDDFALFGNDKRMLWHWRSAIIDRLAQLRLRLHAHSTQVAATAGGTPWLGFVVYPDHLRVKSRQVRHSTRRLHALYAAWQDGEISFARFDAAVQGWVNHVQQADSWGLRAHVLAPFTLEPGFAPLYAGRRR